MKEFIRNFNKQKIVGFLNIVSLSLGIMVAIIVGLWSLNELSFDTFHKDKGITYRIVQHVDFNGTRTKTGQVFKPMGEEAKDNLPQIEALCRFIHQHIDMQVNEKTYADVKIVASDENFFTFFSFELKEGDPNTVLDAPDKMVLSEEAAKQYFPGQDPMGQSIIIHGTSHIVTGIMKNMPCNSSIRTDIVTPSFDWMLRDTWGTNDGYVTFFKIPNKTDLPIISEQLKNSVLQAVPMFKSVNPEYGLEPLTQLHFAEGFLFDSIEKGNKSLVFIFILVAFIILIISCINFTNLFISTSFIRARAIGIKKTQGAKKESLIVSFYLETACYTFIAIVIGILLAYFALPIFNNFVQSQLVIDPTSPQLYIFLIAVFLFTVIIAGTFPAFYMTRFNPIETLSGQFKGKRISIFQKSLLILQFTASIALLMVILFMQKQVDYMIAQDLGFNKENVIYVNGKGDFGNSNFKSFQDEMMKEPSIVNVTRKNSLPMDWRNGWGIKNEGMTDSEEMVIEVNHIQENYFDFMQIEMAAGENPFYLEGEESSKSIILNEKAVEALGLDQPIGKTVVMNGVNLAVKGVIKDVMVKSFHQEVHPQAYFKMPDNFWSHVLFFKVTGDPQRAISHIEQKWMEKNPNTPFEYHFLDDAYKQLYNSEMSAGKVLNFAMLITFIISIAGLFAMAYYVTQRRVREIGLRKVNGATLSDLLLLLNKDFVLWTAIAYLIALPIAYFGLKSWLSTFTIQTSLSIGLFILVGLIAFAVTILTTSFQTFQVANMNPVKTLKSE